MRITGLKGEDLAVNYLKKKGYRILEKNFRTQLGEIDIIAEQNGTIVFVEVKTRTTDAFGLPEEAVTWQKQERIKKVALLYLKGLKRVPPVRFDVLSIELKPEPVIEHIEYAF
jgi:putative endonuclease